MRVAFRIQTGLPRPGLIGLCLCLLPTLPVQAVEDPEMWRLCAPQPLVEVPHDAAGPDSPIHISADQATSQQDVGLTLQGDVQILQGQQRLNADQATYSDSQGLFVAEGNILYRSPNLQFEGERAEVHIKEQQGVFEEMFYLYPSRHASGHAARITQESADLAVMDEVTYTTCDPSQVDWQIKADTIELDQSTHQGVAHNLLLRFKQVPIFYFPYLRFPISGDRLSGFLFPEISINSSSNTVDIGIPYYWNIAPNYDATITPHLIDRRGVLMDTEFRYLGERSHGELSVGYLPEDPLAGNVERGLLGYHHNTRFTPRWYADAQLNYVTDSAYYTDFGENFDLSRTPYLRNQLETRYTGPRWDVSGKVEVYQTLTGTKPYQRMPQLAVNYLPVGNNRLNLLLGSEYNYFYSADQTVQGSRLDSMVGLTYPYVGRAGFFTPRLSWHTTQYTVEDTLSHTTTTPGRELPVVSLDSGLYLERSIATNRLTQTLEPRLYYLYVPYVDQDALPNFDSSSYTIDFNQLFRENRFSGGDRIGDANQLTLALSSRILNSRSGREHLALSFGQSIYYADRLVTLQGGSPDTRSNSDLFAELTAHFRDHWRWRSTLQWTPESDLIRLSNHRLQYKADRGHIFNLDYRYGYDPASTPTTLTQADVSALWQLGPRWHAYGRYKYDILNAESVDAMAGFGYESCCWSLRLTQRDYRPSSGAAVDSSVVFEFEFKGLASAGGRVEEQLKSGILGYESKPR